MKELFLISYLFNQDEYADMLQLTKPESLYEKLVFYQMMQSLRVMNGAKGNMLADQFAKPLNRMMARRLIAYFEREFQLQLNIPNEIRQAWDYKFWANT